MNPIRTPPLHIGAHVPLWLVWLTAAGFILLGLGGSGILDNNEGLYAEIPREMLAAGSWKAWVIPHLNGLPYMEKPPLLYWLTALSFALFGQSEWSARLVPALSALAVVAMLLWFGRAVYRPQAGRLAALMFASGIGVAAMSRVLMFDMLLTALLTAALMCGWRYHAEGKRRFVRWSYAFLALALLAKGFVALVLYGLVLGVFLASTQRSFKDAARTLVKWLEPVALLILAAIAVPWHVAAGLTEPVFSWFYFINEHVLRFLGRREPHDYYAGPWWYYLPRMLIYLFPWCLLLLTLPRRPEREPDQESRPLQRFLWLAWLLPLTFFSISSAKANYYLVAVMPFAAFHLALALEDRGFLRVPRRALPGLLIGAAAAAAALAVAAGVVRIAPDLTVAGMLPREFALWALGGLALAGFAGALLARMNANVGVLAYLLPAAWSAGALWLVLGAMQAIVSTRPLAQWIQHELPGHSVYLYRDFEQKSSLPFYLKQPVPVLDMRSNDLFWGDRLRPGNAVALPAERVKALMPGQRVAVVVADRHLQDFKKTGLQAGFKGEKRIGETTVWFN